MFVFKIVKAKRQGHHPCLFVWYFFNAQSILWTYVPCFNYIPHHTILPILYVAAPRFSPLYKICNHYFLLELIHIINLVCMAQILSPCLLLRINPTVTLLLVLLHLYAMTHYYHQDLMLINI